MTISRAFVLARLAEVSAVASLLTACSSSKPAATGPATASNPNPDVQMSDPDEYRIPHVSEQAGNDIFARTGIGDPYRTGLPLPIFLALMEQYPDVLGKDLDAMSAKFGFIPRKADPASKDRDVRAGLPTGFHLTDDPITHVQFVVHNCALCHTEVVRWHDASGKTQEKQVLGMGNRALRIHAFEDAIATITRDPGLDREHLLPRADRLAKEGDLSWPTAWRGTVVGGTIKGLKARLVPREATLPKIKDGLPGRVAVIESFAAALDPLVKHEVHTNGTVGWTKIPDTIGYGVKRTLSWDGGSEGPSDALVVDADIAAGARIEWLTNHPWQGASLSAFLRHLPRDLPFPGTIDAALAKKGRGAFEKSCSGCHGTYHEDGRAKSYAEQIIPLQYVDTDPARANAVTDEFVSAANDPRLQPLGGLVHTQRTNGYVPPVLTSIWARAPYGHAGQWPSLAVMAMAPEKRPTKFTVHGAAPLDLKSIGLAYDEAAPKEPGDYAQDGSIDGFRVGGHPFIADLGSDARAVLEYLKTL